MVAQAGLHAVTIAVPSMGHFTAWVRIILVIIKLDVLMFFIVVLADSFKIYATIMTFL